jgi:hypothetical protein
MKIDQKSIILPREGHIMVQLDVIVLYINFHLKAQVGYPLVLRETISSQRKLAENSFFPMRTIFYLG